MSNKKTRDKTAAQLYRKAERAYEQSNDSEAYALIKLTREKARVLKDVATLSCTYKLEALLRADSGELEVAERLARKFLRSVERYKLADLHLIALDVLSNILMVSKKYLEAEPIVSKLLTKSRKLGEKLAEADALVQIAELQEVRNNYQASLVYLRDCIAIHEEDDTNDAVATYLLDYARVLFKSGDLIAALERIEKSEKLAKEHNYLMLKAESLMLRGDIYSATHDINKALALYEQAFDEIDDGDQSPTLPNVLERIGLLLLNSNENNRALDWYSFARQQLDMHNVLNLYPFVEFGFGACMNAMNNFNAAKDHLWKALEIAGPNFVLHREVTLNTLNQLAYASKQLGESDLSRSCEQLSSQFSQQLNSSSGSNINVISVLTDTQAELTVFVSKNKFGLGRFFKHGAFRIDLVERTVFRGKRKTGKSLTYPQIAVLTELARNQGKLLTHLEIVQVNNPKADEKTEAIGALSRYYIEKIRSVTNYSFIKTVWGEGYMIPKK